MGEEEIPKSRLFSDFIHLCSDFIHNAFFSKQKEGNHEVEMIKSPLYSGEKEGEDTIEGK